MTQKISRRPLVADHHIGRIIQLSLPAQKHFVYDANVIDATAEDML